jgi:hypothetical protein
VDGISMPLILLTTFTTVLGGDRRLDGDREARGAVLRRLPDHGRADDRRVLGHSMRCCSTFFWEAMLIPMFLIIGVWGGPRRVYATIKFFLYTFIGSRADAGGAHLHVCEGGHYDRQLPAAAADPHRADVHFPGLLLPPSR